MENGHGKVPVSSTDNPDNDQLAVPLGIPDPQHVDLPIHRDEQSAVVSLMQAQIDVQSEKIEKHETMIQDLISQVQELKILLTSERNAKHEAEKKVEPDWTSSSDRTSALPMSIADMVKETAESTIAQSGFVYDQNSGLYYDQTSGLYYDSARGLYYNGHTRTYYTVDPETQQYLFHSQLPPAETEVLPKRRSKKTKRKASSKEKPVEQPKKKEKPKDIKVKRGVDDDIEDGELSSSSSVSIIEQESSDSDASHGTVVLDDEDDVEDIESSKEHAPCIRAIVLESTVTELKKGFLFLVTCTGGTIGREGTQHTICISDPMISKNHAQITYDYEEVSITGTDKQESKPMRKTYLISDLGSQNGTILNGNRLSNPLRYSEPTEILHGSTLQMGGTKLLLHIHSGQLTCGHCEPGLILTKEPMYSGITSKKKQEAIRKKNLKQLRRKYGIEPNQMPKVSSSSSSYKDRAGDRRQTLGSDNPYEKTAVASIDEAIKEDNKGFKMMSKMGWSSGDSLGQTKDSGIREPVKFEVRLGRAGLGAGVPVHLPIPARHNKKAFHDKYRTDVLQRTIQRFITAQPAVPASAPATSSSSVKAKAKSSVTDIIEID